MAILHVLHHTGRPAGRERRTYEIAIDDHHQIICRNGGSGIRVNHHLLKSLSHSLESTGGYAQIDSHVTFPGLCPECQKKPYKRKTQCTTLPCNFISLMAF
jgi:Fe2+ or Zn2+ uptake regulation protein